MSALSIAQNLPADILFIILKDAVQSTIPDERSLATLSLSHVCSSFRRAALRCPTLWTCLSRRLGRPGLALIEACMERSQDQPLDVTFSFYPISPQDEPLPHRLRQETMVVDNIVQAVLSSSIRWRSCSIRLTSDDSRDRLSSTTFDLDSFASTIYIPTPMLKDFSIEEDASLAERFPFNTRGRTMIKNFRPGAHWSLPNLRNVTLRNTLANTIPWPSLSRIQSLRWALTDDELGLVNHIFYMRYLASATSLTHLHLSLIDCRVLSTSALPVVELPSVKTVHVEVLGSSLASSNVAAMWHALSKIHLPNALELNLFFDLGKENKGIPLVVWNEYIAGYDSSLAVSGPQSPFPSLETLSISLWVDAGSKFVDPPTILVPHYCIPSSLKHLRVKSSFDVTLNDTNANARTTPGLFLNTSLQTITFDLPSVRGVAQWMRGLARKMMDRRIWSAFSELKLVRGGELEVIPRDRVLQWCDVVEEPGSRPPSATKQFLSDKATTP
ncbi:hypothetical protein SCHPADRAFT_938700 [Schizopora paradoxa]|uniref:Uncharacterized protein n=1 Tax=Schizopora paradoxa TaxID=27342 RepID=A0A0H2S143_9AGAM|nr:hypothetical protein SCHPADRAFT_938700 [Schizopora paradoxa]